MLRLLCLVLVLFGGHGAAAPCRQALALGLDVSGSVDSGEYRLQLDGLAAALLSPRVAAAILTRSETPVHLAVFEWSEARHQTMLIDWTPLLDPADLERVAERLRGVRRDPGTPPGTALGAAMRFGTTLLAQGPGCWRRTLDLSGDGKNNQGPHPRAVKDGLSGTRVTINALVVGADAPALGDRRQVEIGELSSYFRAWVIKGSDSFVETALGFEDFKAAMTRKLLRELDGVVLSER